MQSYLFAFFLLSFVTIAYAQPKLDVEQNKKIESLQSRYSKLERKLNQIKSQLSTSQEKETQGQKASELKSSGPKLAGFEISGQMTLIYQSSSHKSHKNATGTFLTDLVVDKELGNGAFQLDLQYANGGGVDAALPGGAMVNNDVMEDTSHHSQPYLAKAFYEHTFNPFSDYSFIVDIGKMGVNDFFDLGLQVSDQTTQFLNQAINNNGAFDFVQDLNGHGYTYGLRLALENKLWGVDLGFFSSDSHLDNIEKKHSILGALKWTPEWFEGVKSLYQIYYFKNFGEYGEFKVDGSFVSLDSALINSESNADNLDKSGFGVSLNQAFPGGFDLFVKYGQQDDDRDIRHYQDMDESIMFGASLQGEKWSREDDGVGVAYHIGKLKGNHKKAHELGYTSVFDRSSGIGIGNYKDERVFEVYYRFALHKNHGLSADYQHITNFNYDKNSKNVHFYALRYNMTY